VSESLLHRVARTVDVTEHAKRERKKAPVPVSIRIFDSGDEVSIRNAHNSLLTHETPRTFSRDLVDDPSAGERLDDRSDPSPGGP
jgi:hypothetical protein